MAHPPSRRPAPPDASPRASGLVDRGGARVAQHAANSAGERLSKRVMQLAGCSRSEAELAIAAGLVRVDGVLAEQPMQRVQGEQVSVEPLRGLNLSAPVTLLLHKPAELDPLAPTGAAAAAGVGLQAGGHWADDPSGQPVLKRHFIQLQAPMALPRAASGLVVFSQDGRVLRKLHEDAAWIEHEWLVEVVGQVSDGALRQLNAGAPEAAGWRASINSSSAHGTRLRVVFKGTHPGLVALRCERALLQITSMKRLRIGRVGLGHLPCGQWRYLLPTERF